MLWRFQNSLFKMFEKVQFLCIQLFCDNMLWEFQKPIVEKFKKEFNSYVFYYFVMKCCEDFKNHSWKIWKSSILMFSIILWWIAVRISQIIVKSFEKVEFLCILLFCDEMLWGFQKLLSQSFENKVQKEFWYFLSISQSIRLRIQFFKIVNNDF